MIKVYFKKQSNYPLKAKLVKEHLRKSLNKGGIVSNSFVSVVVVGKKKMLDISRSYLKDNMMHAVLSFTEDEIKEKFVYPPNDYIFLGEIVLCYPQIVDEAKKEGKRIDAKTKELLEHAALHLLGVHHE